MPYFLVNEIKSSRGFTPTFALYIATFQSTAHWCLGKSSKSFQRESSPKPFSPCAHLQVSLEMSALFHKCDGLQWPEPWSWLTYQLNFKLMSNCFCTSQTSYGPEGKMSKWLGKSRSKPSSLKRPTEKAWTQKLLKIFMQSLLRNVRKYYFRILWHIMRTGNLRYESTIQHEESSFMCQVTF